MLNRPHLPRLHSVVVEDVLAQVISQQLSPGTILPTESEMTAHYGVSRSVVREAIRILAEKGVVVVRQGKGSEVAPPARWNQLDQQILIARLKTGSAEEVVKDLMESRLMLEVECAGLAARRAGPDQIQELRRLLEQMDRNLSDERAYTDYDNLFHQQIWEAAGNRILLGMILPMADVFGTAKYLSTLRRQLRPSLDQHWEVFHAVAAHDEAGARAAMRRHITAFEANLRSALQGSRPGDLMPGENERTRGIGG